MKIKNIISNNKKITIFFKIFALISLYLYFTFFLLIVFSQTETRERIDILSTLVALIPIFVIVLILLYLGGILKFQRIGINWIFLLYFILIVVIFVLPLLQRFGFIHIFPDNPEELFKKEEFKGFKLYSLPSPICKLFTSLTISESVACYMPAFLYFFLLPFVAIFAITWAFLKQLKIFEGLERRIEGLIAFIITFMTLPMGTFILLIAFWFSFAGAFSVAIFIIMFLVGVFFRGYGFIEEKHLEYVGKRAREEHLKKVTTIAKLTIDKINRATDIDEVIRAVEWFMERTGYYADISQIDDIRRKPTLTDAKTAAETLVKNLAAKAS